MQLFNAWLSSCLMVIWFSLIKKIMDHYLANKKNFSAPVVIAACPHSFPVFYQVALFRGGTRSGRTLISEFFISRILSHIPHIVFAPTHSLRSPCLSLPSDSFLFLQLGQFLNWVLDRKVVEKERTKFWVFIFFKKKYSKILF